MKNFIITKILYPFVKIFRREIWNAFVETWNPTIIYNGINSDNEVSLEFIANGHTGLRTSFSGDIYYGKLIPSEKEYFWNLGKIK